MFLESLGRAPLSLITLLGKSWAEEFTRGRERFEMSPYRKPAEKEKQKTFLESLSPEDKKLYRKVQRHAVLINTFCLLVFLAILSGMLIPCFVYVSGLGGIAMFFWGLASWIAGIVCTAAIIFASWNSYSGSVERAQKELDRKKFQFESLQEEDSE